MDAHATTYYSIGNKMLDRNKEIKLLVGEILKKVELLQSCVPQDKLIIQAYSIIYKSIINFSMLMGDYENELGKTNE